MNDTHIIIPVWNQKVLSNRNALITGGTSGIGFEMANTFLCADIRNIVITSRSTKKLDNAVCKLKEMHPEKEKNIFGVIMDLADINNFENVLKNVLEYLGNETLDILVNNAGIYQGTKFGTVTDEEWNNLMNINLKAQYFISQIVSNYMVEHKIQGNILNLCSSSSYRPSIDPYMLSKLGMSGLTLGMAKKLIVHGIVVNGIAPGPTFTPMLHKKEGDSLHHGGVPAGRYILPQEIANLAVFLTSSMGRMIVGDVVKITGGSAVTTYDDVRY